MYKTRTRVTVPSVSTRLPNQTVNHDGGAVFSSEPLVALRNFLTIGVSGNSYYVSRETRMKEAQGIITKALQNPFGVAELLRDVASTNSAPSNEESIFVLAKLMRLGSVGTSELVDTMLAVIRTGTHFLHLMVYLREGGKSFGRRLRTVLTHFLNRKGAQWVSFQSAKYPSRDGMSWVDALRLVHPQPWDEDMDSSFGAILGKTVTPEYRLRNMCISTTDANEAIRLVKAYKAPQEFFLTELRNNPDFRRAMLPTMPPHAMLRETRNLYSYGVLSAKSQARETWLDRINDHATLVSKRVHPVDVLKTMLAMRQVVTTDDKVLTAALEKAVYGTLPVLGKPKGSVLIGVDVSGSMGVSSTVGGVQASARTIAAFLALALYRQWGAEVYAFSDRVSAFGMRANDTLDTIHNRMAGMSFGYTDLSMLLKTAQATPRRYSNVLVITDAEINTGSNVWATAQAYREFVGEEVKYAMLATQLTTFTLFDPKHPGTMNIAGFDLGGMRAMSQLFGAEVSDAEAE